MKFTKTAIDGVVVVEPDVFGDHRGFFMESWSKRSFEEAGLCYNIFPFHLEFTQEKERRL